MKSVYQLCAERKKARYKYFRSVSKVTDIQNANTAFSNKPVTPRRRQMFIVGKSSKSIGRKKDRSEKYHGNKELLFEKGGLRLGTT